MPRRHATFLSCDWGTTSFRLRWIADGSVQKEFQNTMGCRTLMEQWERSGNGGKADRTALFEETVRTALEQSQEQERRAFAEAPLIISGMASSSIGWKELPYAALPMSLNGTGLRIEKLAWSKPEWLGDTFLVSGVAGGEEMMRGEETEAIGLMAQEETLPDQGTLLLPGTHSKHLRIDGGAIVEIKTYMTGELFEILARHSVLRASVETNETKPNGTADVAGFAEGVQCVRQRGAGAALFQTRVRHVLRGRPTVENAAFLSGVLIGGELCDLFSEAKRGRIFLGGAARLRDMYQRAMQVLEIEGCTFSDAAVQQAVPRAHELFLGQLIR